MLKTFVSKITVISHKKNCWAMTLFELRRKSSFNLFDAVQLESMSIFAKIVILVSNRRFQDEGQFLFFLLSEANLHIKPQCRNVHL